MTENSALEETIRKAVTETLKSLTPEQLRELTMEPYESRVPLHERWQGMSSEERAEAEQKIWAAQARENAGDLRDADDEELAHTEVPDISSLPPEQPKDEYPRDLHESVLLTDIQPSANQRALIVDYLQGQGIGSIMFTKQELRTLTEEPSEESITGIYGALVVPEVEEPKTDE